MAHTSAFGCLLLWGPHQRHPGPRHRAQGGDVVLWVSSHKRWAPVNTKFWVVGLLILVTEPLAVPPWAVSRVNCPRFRKLLPPRDWC